MVPTQIGLLHEFYSRPAFAKITGKEVEALNFVKNNTPQDSVIVTPPYNQYLDLGSSTPNIWDWFDTSYVAALSGRRTYFDDYEQVDIMGYDWKGRLEVKKTVFAGDDVDTVKNAFADTKGNILYYPKVEAPVVDPGSYGLTKIFENSDAVVWKAN